MLKSFAAAVAVVAVSLAATADDQMVRPRKSSDPKLAEAQKKAAKAQADLLATLRKRAREQLKDPESARFSDEWLYIGEDGSTLSACGMVNAKNSYGAYVGKSGYISTTGGMVLFERPDVPFAPYWQTWCVEPQG